MYEPKVYDAAGRSLMWLIYLWLWCQTGESNDLWENGRWGDTAYVTMEYAPFPHASRADGFTRDGVHYPAQQHYQNSTVAIFIPHGFKPDPRGTHLLFYLHGHRNNVRQSIEQFHLRRQISLSKKNLILVFPQGPMNVPDSSAGKLETPRGLLKLTTEVLNWLVSQKKIESNRPGKVVVSGHSGAYKGLAAMVKHGGLESIRHVILLDATYGGLEEFSNWVSGSKKHRISSIFTDHLAAENLRLIAMLDAKGTNYHVADTRTRAPDKLSPGNWFVYADGLTHDQTTGWLQYFLMTADLPDRKP